jgi:SAM-dependent methyltransferase
MGRRGVLVLGITAASVAAVVARHGRATLIGKQAPEGIVIGDAGMYDAMSRWLLAGFFRGVADDVASVAPDGARVLDLGCGPGQLAILLSREHGLDVTGLDVDPPMIRRARSNAVRAGGRRPSFVVGDVAHLAFRDGAFDLVVSTLSMHHWADATEGLTEIARVLAPGGKALVWDLGPGLGPLHAHLPDPVERAQRSPLRMADAASWRWPGPWHLSTRIELARPSVST